MRGMDEDGSGAVDFDEFYAWFTSDEDDSVMKKRNVKQVDFEVCIMRRPLSIDSSTLYSVHTVLCARARVTLSPSLLSPTLFHNQNRLAYVHLSQIMCPSAPPPPLCVCGVVADPSVRQGARSGAVPRGGFCEAQEHEGKSCSSAAPAAASPRAREALLILCHIFMRNHAEKMAHARGPPESPA
eukprot:COSAG01_NODE_2955_length_6799_cov_5.722090_6_plen_184_part_00